jgi:Fe2+ transport system protein FeoA
MPMRTLDKLDVNEAGIVASIDGVGHAQQRLLEMGVSTGAAIQVTRFAPLGDPMEVFVRGFHLSLRKSEAALVYLEG